MGDGGILPRQGNRGSLATLNLATLNSARHLSHPTTCELFGVRIHSTGSRPA
jgi:hypothetical protein